jgi:lysine-N-methylase
MGLVMPRYLGRFQCLGAACPDNCCHDWRVYVDEEHYERLRARLAPAELAAGMERNTREREPRRHAFLVLREDRTCSFLADGLCTIHARFGADLLPNTCAEFPRSLGTIGARSERIASPACPEVARMVLLDDDALEPVPGGDAELGRAWVARRADPDAADPYEATFLAVRDLVVSLLRAGPYPLGSRLAFGAVFADRTRGFLLRGRGGFDGRAIEELGRSLLGGLERLHRELGARTVDVTYALGVVREILGLPANALGAPLARLVAELGPAYGGLDRPPAELARTHRALPALPPELAARLDVLTQRYAEHELLRSWHVAAPSFAAAYQALLVRVALVRFLVAGLARGRGLEGAAALDALAVQVVYLVGRMLDDSSDLEQQIVAALEQSGARFADALALISL